MLPPWQEFTDLRVLLGLMRVLRVILLAVLHRLTTCHLLAGGTVPIWLAEGQQMPPSRRRDGRNLARPKVPQRMSPSRLQAGRNLARRRAQQMSPSRLREGRAYGPGRVLCRPLLLQRHHHLLSVYSPRGRIYEYSGSTLRQRCW